MTRRLPYALQKRGSMLLHQQCWLWGRDICRKEGNLLIEQGFQRLRPPEGIEGSSQYTLQLEGSLQVRIWGFGIYYGAQRGTYLNRYAFTPLSASISEDVWTPKAFTRLTSSTDLHAVADVVRWMAAYEDGVLERMGSAYRSECLLGWSKRSLQPREFLHALHAFARDLTTFEELHGSIGGEDSTESPVYASPRRDRTMCDTGGAGTCFLRRPGVTQSGTPLFLTT